MITSDINLVSTNDRSVVIGQGIHGYRVELWDNARQRYTKAVMYSNVGGGLTLLQGILGRCQYVKLRGLAIASWQYIN